jgi:hypothetical protein
MVSYSTPSGLIFWVMPNHGFHPWLFTFNPYRGCFFHAKHSLMCVTSVHKMLGRLNKFGNASFLSAGHLPLKTSVSVIAEVVKINCSASINWVCFCISANYPVLCSSPLKKA